MPRKVYSDQFKRDAVAMYENNPDVSLKVVSEDLGINRSTLRVWVDKYGTGTKTTNPTVMRVDRAQRECPIVCVRGLPGLVGTIVTP